LCYYKNSWSLTYLDLFLNYFLGKDIVMRFIFALIAAFVLYTPVANAANDKVNHIACVGGTNSIKDVVRIVSTQVVNTAQVTNLDWLWDNNGSCKLQSVNRKYTTSPQVASQNGVWGYHEVGNVIILKIPSVQGKTWMVKITRVGYFANQIVNGRASSDDLAWKVSEIRDARHWRLPRGCKRHMRQISGAQAIEILNDGRNWGCDK
jgi:hypothetical protein